MKHIEKKINNWNRIFSHFAFCICVLLFAFSLTTCKKLLEVNPPVNTLVTTSVFSGDNTAIAAQLAVYTQMQGLPWSVNAYTGLSSDELTNLSTGQSYQDLYTNNLNASTDGGLLFANLYNYIYLENAVLENVPGSAGVTPNIKKLLLGEAEFTRAFCYFHLVNLYGDVPLITTTNYAVNSVLARAPQTKVYTQIIADLTDALSKLSPNFLDQTDTATTTDRVRPTTWAAWALLARAYLYTEKYDSAILAASNVINNTTLFTLTPLSAAFLKNSYEAIWQLMPPPTQYYTYDGNSFIIIRPPTMNTLLNDNCTISPQLLNAFEPGDQRKNAWIGTYSNGGTWNYPAKYKDYNGTPGVAAAREYSMILRLAEQYLIRAEARAQKNDLSNAISDINAIRQRAGLSPLAGTLSQTQVLLAVAHERQVELFTEGHRWFDLKRTKAVDSIMRIVTPQKGGSWNSYQQLYPLSIRDLAAGINLVQNVGY